MSSLLSPRGSRQRRALQWTRTNANRWLSSASYGQKWLALGSVIGVISGLGAVAFYTALSLATHYLLFDLGGYHVPTPFAEGGLHASTHFVRPWAIPLVAGAGALVASVLVFTIAPDAEGHGTDAAISAVHHNPRGIRMRTVVVKIVASALTIGSGGSGGREGPTGQISAGFGSFLARLFDLSPSDARIGVASGIGSGIGSIFGAPLGGAILATEIMYRDDFEVEALVPSFIASIVGYSVWGSVEGFGPLFGNAGNYRFDNATQLIWFAIIGTLGGLVGLLYAKGFYGIAALFERLPGPRWIRPAIGGAAVGSIGLILPEVLGTGYGWIQQGLGPRLLTIPLWAVLLIPFARIVATGLSIGSGGAGGIFGPGMVIGGFVGASVWRLLEPIAPSVGHDPAPFVIVGMMSCFGSISRAPLAVMLMVAEMTNSFALIVPAMVAVGLATLIVRRGDDTIYRSQLRSRADSPAHQLATGLPLLAAIETSRAMSSPRCVVRDDESVNDAIVALREAGVTAAPLVDVDSRFIGVVELTELVSRVRDADDNISRLMNSSWTPVQTTRHLDVVLEILTSWSISWLPVIDGDRRVVGIVSISDIANCYRTVLAENLSLATRLGDSSGLLVVVVASSSALDRARVSSAHLPKGLLITAIDRGHVVIVPAGDAQLHAGDRITVIGSPDDLRKLEHLNRVTQE